MIIVAVLSTAVDHVLHVTGIYPPYGEPFFDTGLLTLSSAYRFLFQVFGAWVAARIAKEHASKALWTMGIIGAILWMAGTLAMPDMAPLWYGIVGAILSIPSALLGGKFVKQSGQPS